MNKISLNKPTDLDSIRRAEQSEVKRTEKSDGVESNQKNALSSGDKLQFSNRAAEVGQLVSQIKELPDVRQDRVNELRERISNGEFKPTGKEIADAIIREEG